MRTSLRYPGRPACRSAFLVFVAAGACGGGDDERPAPPPSATGGRLGVGGTSAISGATSAGSGTGGSAACDDCQAGAGGELGFCGDGAAQPGETCDDGNVEPEDGCAADCRVEPGFVCELGQPCRAISVDSACADACWDGDACIEIESGVTCQCPEPEPDACDQLSFRSLVRPEGWSSCDARAVSGDGATVVGACSRIDQDNQERWTVPVVWGLGAGVRVFEEAPEGSVLNAVNADGSVFVGFDGQGRALRFSDGELEVVAASGVASSTSADGSVIVGYSGETAFRWEGDAELTSLEGPDGETESYALAVNADGSLTVGLIRDAGRAHAVRWNAEGDAELLPVPDEATDSEAIALSDDGSVIVGSVWFDDESQAVRWTDAGFEALSGATPSVARAVSADGSRIVGSADLEPGSWNQAGEFVSLRDELSGANLEDWSFSGVAGVSSDGAVMVGTAHYLGGEAPSPESRAFVAFVP